MHSVLSYRSLELGLHSPNFCMAKQVLGKGLGALFQAPAGVAGVAKPPPLSQPLASDSVQRVPLSDVVPSPLQPRKEFAQEQLEELMASIKEHGVIQPLIVRPVNGKLELIAGERRFRASRELGLDRVPVIVRQASDRDVLEMALIENLQRENLNPIEEAMAYDRLVSEFKMRQEDIAKRVGKNRATVANTLRLLDLPPAVRKHLGEGRITSGHAKVLLSLKNEKDQEAAADEALRKQLTVRALEKLVQSISAPKPLTPDKKPAVGTDVQQAVGAVEQRLTRHFSTNVSVTHGDKKGKIEIDYYGTDDLNRLLALMKVQEEDFD
jgi:ParB family transcriptional regulator, chromosome partitioning protein